MLLAIGYVLVGNTPRDGSLYQVLCTDYYDIDLFEFIVFCYPHQLFIPVVYR